MFHYTSQFHTLKVLKIWLWMASETSLSAYTNGTLKYLMIVCYFNNLNKSNYILLTIAVLHLPWSHLRTLRSNPWQMEWSVLVTISTIIDVMSSCIPHLSEVPLIQTPLRSDQSVSSSHSQLWNIHLVGNVLLAGNASNSNSAALVPILRAS